MFINDFEYPLRDTNLLNALHITTTVRGSVPLLSLSITDISRSFDSLNLQDGIPIRVVIKPSDLSSRTYLFRKFNHKSVFDGAAYNWTIVGYLDAPVYWNTTTSKGLRGTSNDVLADIAGNCSLKFDGTTTNDSQLWLPNNSTYRGFAKDIASCGFVDTTSCMVLAVDLDSTMRYKNVNNLPRPTKNIVAYQQAPGSITAIDMKLDAASGFNNAVTGYQNMRYAQSSVADDLHTQIDELSFVPDATSPLYNSKLKKALGRGPVRFGPIDVGNVHDNYEKSSYQNTRYKNLFSMGLELLIPSLSDIQLLERINFAVQREDNSPDTVNSGTYTVTGHSLYIEGPKYAEKVGLVRHGTNERYTEG